MGRFRYDYVISLGPDCQAETQAKKYFPRLQHETGPMGSQITPLPALLAYIANDFQGMFEREDIVVGNKGGGRNVKYGTIHPYEFPNGWASYENARSRHDYLCGKMRAIMRSGKGVLFLYGTDDKSVLPVIAGALMDRYPDLDFRIISARSPLPNSQWSLQKLAEWKAPTDHAKRQWGRSGLVFGLKAQAYRLKHHLTTARF